MNPRRHRHRADPRTALRAADQHTRLRLVSCLALGLVAVGVGTLVSMTGGALWAHRGPHDSAGPGPSSFAQTTAPGALPPPAGKPVVAPGTAPPVTAPGTAVFPPHPEVRGRGAVGWRDVLGRLDDVRARAWARGDPRLLAAVYTPQSRALSLDRSQIRRYHRRGLHVNGVHLDFGRVLVLHREPHLVRLRVVDRLSPMTALTRSGSPRSLPRDRPSRHLLVLRRTAVGWRIARVHAL